MSFFVGVGKRVQKGQRDKRDTRDTLCKLQRLLVEALLLSFLLSLSCVPFATRECPFCALTGVSSGERLEISHSFVPI